MNQKLVQKLRTEKMAVGTHITLCDSAITELIGGMGFDYLWIDTEHTVMSLETLQRHLIAARAAGVSAIVRAPWVDEVLAKHILEMGPDGIVFPMIRSVADAEKAVSICTYPPRGVRGVGPRRANMYGRIPLQEYVDYMARDFLLFVQIEHIDAVNALDDILAVDGIDGFILGAFDLSSSMGKMGQLNDLEVAAAIDLTIHKVRASGKIMGLSLGDIPETEMKKWFARGISMMSIGMDTDYLISGAERVLQGLRRAEKGE